MNESVHFTINITRHCFRLHKAALRQLGTPKYIQLMIHPDGTRIIVKACDQSEEQSLKINMRRFETKSSIELYSKSLVDKVIAACNLEEQNGGSYKLTGETLPSHNLAVFYIASMRRIERG